MHKISYCLVIRNNRCQRDCITCVYIPSYHALSYPHYQGRGYRGVRGCNTPQASSLSANLLRIKVLSAIFRKSILSQEDDS